MTQPPLRSSLGASTPTTVTVHGFDLPTELMGRVGLGDMGFLSLTGRLPDERESAVFGACLVTLVEHGATPSSLATRLTLLGAPESVQGAVAAGILGLGERFVGSIEGAARLSQETLERNDADGDLAQMAAVVVAAHRRAGRPLPGFGHPVHEPVDPRTERLFEIAGDHGFRGRHVALLEAVSTEAGRRRGRPLLINATGAIGAVAGELGLPWRICRGIGVMARAVGLVGHVLEESRAPIAGDIWRRVDEEISRHGETAERERDEDRGSDDAGP
jgi:citrate synthase